MKPIVARFTIRGLRIAQSIKTSNETPRRMYIIAADVSVREISHTHEHHRCKVLIDFESCEVSNSQKPSANNAFYQNVVAKTFRMMAIS